jgi:hypothetical protein
VTQSVPAQKRQPVAKAQFISQADGLCQAVLNEIKPLRDQFQLRSRQLDFRHLADVTRQIADAIHKGVANLRSLQPPAADVRVINQWLTLSQAQVPLAGRLADALQVRDRAKITSAGQHFLSEGAKARGIAQMYGLKVCGSGN